MARLLRPVLAAFAVLLAAVSYPASAGMPPDQRGDGWAVAAPEAAGFDPAALEALAEDILRGGHGNIHAVLVEHDGRLVFERYFEGSDESWGQVLGTVRFGPDSLHDLRSVTKSVTTLLLGVALGSGYDQALDAPVTSYFPDLEGRFGEGAGQVKLRHVLTMTAGLQWNEMSVPYTDPDNDEVRMSGVHDPVALVLGRPVQELPGTRWDYNGGLTQVVAGLIERRTGKRLREYADEILFSPLGIVTYEWRGSRKWGVGGLPSAASGLRLRPRDLAKIGSLALHDGAWRGRQVVPAEWITLIRQRAVETIPWVPDGTYGYGFMWYSGRLKDGSDLEVLGASGNGQQRLYVVPARRVVVTVLAGMYNQRSKGEVERLFREILAAQRTER